MLFLYVDDDPDMINLVRVVSKRIPNLEIQCLMDPREGLIAAEKLKPDLVIVDLHMPQMEGTELIDQMRKTPSLSKIPVLVVTAETDVDIIGKIRERSHVGVFDKTMGAMKLPEAAVQFLTNL